MDDLNLTFLGKGWAFPTAFDPYDNKVGMVKELEDIEQSIYILMSTIPGERLMRPDYGCDLYSLVFENFDQTVQTRAIDMIKTAILHYEPRVKVEKVTIETEPMKGKALINIFYFIPKVNSRHNMVYPYYFKEGTNLSSLTDLER